MALQLAVHLSRVEATIRRRILLNFRLPPELAAPLLPPPFRPRMVGGFALAGLCVIRLEHMRPGFVPLGVGLASDNAAHRIAVEWTDPHGDTRFGVYIPRRDTNSTFIRFTGARVFPGQHRPAAFLFEEDPDGSMRESAVDASGLLFSIAARPADHPAQRSVFRSIVEAATFFNSGADGYAPGSEAGHLDGVGLSCSYRPLQPLEISHAYVRELIRMFPAGSLEFDSAFILRDVASTWRRVPPLRIPARTSSAPGGDHCRHARRLRLSSPLTDLCAGRPCVHCHMFLPVAQRRFGSHTREPGVDLSDTDRAFAPFDA